MSLKSEKFCEEVVQHAVIIGCRDLEMAFVVFFQAEDGIRYLVRSRGLGDVYKRQTKGLITTGVILFDIPSKASKNNNILKNGLHWLRAVSYTHLTLPTSDLV